MTDEINPRKEEAEAFERIARTDDGRLIHRYFRRVLETVIDIQEVGALYAHNGRRSLARDVMRQMAEGINARSESGNDPILARSGPVAVGGTRRRRDPRAYPRVDSNFTEPDPVDSAEPS